MEPEEIMQSLNSLQQNEPESRHLPADPPESPLESRFDSNYRYVLVAARRARQLQKGSPPLVPTRSSKACRIAQDEIAAGLVHYVRLPGRAGSRASGSLMNTYSA